MEEDATDAGGSSAVENEEAKKASSYRYWVRSEMTGAAPAPLPRKLTEREMVVGNGKPLPLGSLWNQAGTWEEKSLNSWAWKRIKDLLQGVEPVEFEDGKAQVVEVSSCSGDATLVTVRQKKRVGYSFEIDMKVKMEVSTDEGLKKDVEGTMKVPEACYGELDDLQLEISITQSQIADAVQRSRVTQALVASFLPAIRCKLEQFETELKERLIMTPLTESPSLENPCDKIQLKLVKTFIVSIQRVVLDAELLKFCSKCFVMRRVAKAWK